MASKRKPKFPVPDNLEVEVVVWNDHQAAQNQPLDLEIPECTSVGFLLFEDENQIILASSIFKDDHADLFADNAQVEYAQILKPVVVSRRKLHD